MEEALTLLIDTIGDFLKTDHDAIDWDTKPSPGEWSKKEILGHLIDSAQVNIARFTRCTYEQNFKLVYAQNEWVATKHYQETDIKEILDLWILLNRQIVRILSNYPADKLHAVCDTGKNEVQLHTVEWLAGDYVVHMRHHLRQIAPGVF
jgi:hypothetical protein